MVETKSVTRGVPRLEEVEAYCSELHSNVNPSKFFNYYSEANWMLGGRPISDWRALFRSWHEREFKKRPSRAEEARASRNRMATMDDPEFAKAVEEFHNGGWKRVYKKIAGPDYKTKWEKQTGEKWVD